MVEDLFTDKVIESDNVEENEENITNNSIAVTNTQTSKDKDGNNSINKKEIKIELLNGTDENTLNKVKEKLEKEGYTVSKTNETSKTTTTTIINRTNQSKDIENDIKEILGVGNKTIGANNSKVDFTIIIGKDYK